MKEKGRCTLRGKYSTPQAKQENNDLCIHSSSFKHLPYHKLISNGKITVSYCWEVCKRWFVTSSICYSEFPPHYSLTSTCLIGNLR